MPLFSASRVSSDASSKAFARLRHTSTFRGNGLESWNKTVIAVFGAGLLGGNMVCELIRSGAAAVCVFDPDIGSPENMATQIAEPGVHKVDSVVRICDAFRPGRVRGFPIDVRHAGVGLLAQMDLFLDCTDDPSLAWPLTQISNGLKVPMLRCAVDGSGQAELGRVLYSNGGAGHACQVCNFDWQDTFGAKRRTPCPGQAAASSQPTLAGNAIGMALAGFALLQAQRLATGNDTDQVVNREVLLDLSHGQLFNMELPRSPSCLSGHTAWELFRPGLATAEATLSTIFQIGREHFGTPRVSVEPFLHPIQVRATCECSEPRKAVGTPWTSPPSCPRCGKRMSWQRHSEFDRISPFDARELGILETPLQTLGLPEEGALFIVRVEGVKPLYLGLD